MQDKNNLGAQAGLPRNLVLAVADYVKRGSSGTALHIFIPSYYAILPKYEETKTQNATKWTTCLTGQ